MSAEKISNTKMKTIYIPLLNEGTPTFRPTKGLQLGKDIFKVLATEAYDPDDEEWEFSPETIVACEKELRRGEYLLIARTRVNTPIVSVQNAAFESLPLPQ